MGEGVGADAGVGLVAAGEGVGVAPGVAGVGSLAGRGAESWGSTIGETGVSFVSGFCMPTQMSTTSAITDTAISLRDLGLMIIAMVRL